MVVATEVDGGVVVVAEEATLIKIPTSNQTRPLQVRSTPEPNTLTSQQGSGRGVLCTSNGGGGVTFVVTPPHVRGKMFTPPSLKNEALTSSNL